MIRPSMTRPFRLFAALLLGAGLAQAQLTQPPLTQNPLTQPLTQPGLIPPPTDVDASLRTLIPSTLVLSRPAQASAIAFDLGKDFPPLKFPATYPAKPQEFQVYASTARPWTVQMQVRSQPDKAGHSIPVTQLRYRVNDGPWQAVTDTPQVVQSSAGPTPGWLPLKVEFQLNLLGSEYGGEYRFDVAFTGLVLP